MNRRTSYVGAGVLALGLCAVGGGCAATPAQTAVQDRQAFNAMLETIHQLHVQGVLGTDRERQLLPAVQAGAAALQQMDADVAAGNQADFASARAALLAATAQLSAAVANAGLAAFTATPAAATGSRTQPVTSRPAAAPNGG